MFTRRKDLEFTDITALVSFFTPTGDYTNHVEPNSHLRWRLYQALLENAGGS